jgi:hypothetical protein
MLTRRHGGLGDESAGDRLGDMWRRGEDGAES